MISMFVECSNNVENKERKQTGMKMTEEYSIKNIKTQRVEKATWKLKK